MPGHFLVKSEPYKYSFAQLQKDGRTTWDGVRNFEARNNLRAMKKGDRLLYYHSNEGKEVVGVARVGKEAFPDPTQDPGEDWAAVEVEPLLPLHKPVALSAIKAEPRLQDIALLRKSRLSVVPVTPAEFKLILQMGQTKLPKGA
jgi:predicted RNA-binding protein with PUA-like domain